MGKAGRTPRRMDRANAQALAGDALKIIPSCVWCIVCLVAIPSYASIDWHGAVFTAIFSMCLCILAARDAIGVTERAQGTDQAPLCRGLLIHFCLPDRVLP